MEWRVAMRRWRRSLTDEGGFGIVEIMVSMILLALLFMALISLLINALQVTAKNTTIATATQLVTQRIEEARTFAVTGDCGVLRGIVENTEIVTDGRGIELEVTGSFDCTQDASNPHGDPQLARASVQVTTEQAGFSDPVAEATTDIFVKFIP